jgi:hypothetical protein
MKVFRFLDEHKSKAFVLQSLSYYKIERKRILTINGVALVFNGINDMKDI